MTIIKKIFRIVPVLSILLLCPGLCFGQNDRREARHRNFYRKVAKVDSILLAKAKVVDYDSLYIEKPLNRWTFTTKGNLSGSFFRAHGSTGSYEGRGRLTSTNVGTISIGASYRGLSAGFSINPGSMSGRNKDYEFALTSYSNKYGFDVVYQKTKTLSGKVRVNGKDVFVDKDMVDMNFLLVNAYYAFNGRRFSYPAAFSQNYIQKRSAGSLIAGFTYMGGTTKAGDSKPDGVPDFRIYAGHWGLGMGYGYNFVLWDKYLLHLSGIPTIVVYNSSNIKIDGKRKYVGTTFPDIMLIGRAAIVRNFGRKVFVGASLLMNESLFGDRDLDIDHNKWEAHLSVGYRL